MKLREKFTQDNYQDWICPDIRAYWKLRKIRDVDQFLLQELDGKRQFPLSPAEGFALQYFTGRYKVEQLQERCNQEFGDLVPSNFVLELLEKLVELGILAPHTGDCAPTLIAPGPCLKPGVQWFEHPDGHWILRNAEDFTFLQVNDFGKAVSEELGWLPQTAILQKYDITLDELKQLLKLLTLTGMLVGTKPQKLLRGKFTPLQLLFFVVPLFNPDAWLTQHVNCLRWIWTRTFAFILLVFLACSAVVGLSQQAEIVSMGQDLWQYYRASLVLPFGILAMLVVSIHELSHAFTLKYYGGIVPEMGLLFMLLIPAAYTDTTDGYCLMKRSQRVLVVGAGVLCQLTIGAIALWLWNLSASGTWLHTGSYLLMVAALFTVAINLNPLAKFDGYYLAVALSGINNLRDRSFKFYTNLFCGQPIREKQQIQWVLALYAPLSLTYTLFIFSFLLFQVLDWSLMNLSIWPLILLILWAIYFYFPTSATTASTTMTSSTTNSRSRPQSSQSVPPASVPAVQNARSVPNATATPARSPHRWLKFGLMTIVVVGAGFIPTPFDVGGPVELETRDTARDWVRPLISGVITEIRVKSGDKVERNDILAKLRSPELEKEIAEVRQELAEGRQLLESLQTQQILAQADLAKSQAIGQASQDKADRFSDRVTKLTQGKLTPEIQELIAQQQELKASLQEAEMKGKRYQMLYDEGAVSRQELDTVLTQRQVAQQKLDAKTAALEAAKQQLQDTTIDLQAEADSRAAAIRADQIVVIAKGKVSAVRATIDTLEKRLQELEALKASLTLRAPIAGTITTRDLDLKLGAKLEVGADFVEIASLQELTATVTLSEEDAKFASIGQTVTFRPRQDKLKRYEATVAEILPQMESDDLKQKRVAKVRIVIDNADGNLKPKASGYAKIWSEWIPLYQRLGRVIIRLMPIERLLP